jgi:hypothetical protein
VLAAPLYQFVHALLHRSTTLITTYSAPGIHVLDGFVPLFLCAHAHQGGQSLAGLRGRLLTPVQDQVLKSGFMTKKTQRTRRWIRRWFILKNDTLAWYQSSAVRAHTCPADPN